MAAPTGGASGLFGVRGLGLWEKLQTVADTGGCLPDRRVERPERLEWPAVSCLPGGPDGRQGCLPSRADPDDFQTTEHLLEAEELEVQVLARCRAGLVGASGGALRLTASAAQDGVLLQVDGPGCRPRAFRLGGYFGPMDGQDVVAAKLAGLAKQAVEGRHCAVLCCGPPGAGKAHTLFGLDALSADRDPSQAGLVERLTKSVFDGIAAVMDGIIVVKASFLRIRGRGGGHEELTDLLATGRSALQLARDPLDRQKFSCVGLSQTVVNTPEEVGTRLRAGLARAAQLDAGRGKEDDEPVQLVFTLGLEEIEVTQRRSSLAFVCLAGRDGAALAFEPVRQPSLMRLLRGLRSQGAGRASVALLAAVTPALDAAPDVCETLAHVEQFVRSAAAPEQAPGDDSPVQETDGPVASLKHRNQECIKLIQQRRTQADQQKLELTQTLEATREKAAESEVLQVKLAEQQGEETLRTVEQVKGEMERGITQGLKLMQAQAFGDVHNFTETLQVHMAALNRQRQMQQDGAETAAELTAEARRAAEAQRCAELEVTALRQRLASTEVRAQLLQDELEELVTERRGCADERARLRQQAEQHREQQAAVERELHTVVAEQTLLQREVHRLTDTTKEAESTLSRERERQVAEEADLRNAKDRLQQELSGVRKGIEVQCARAESEQGELLAKLKGRLRKLEEAAGDWQPKLERAREQQAKLEIEHRILLQREEGLRQEQPDVAQKRKELEDIRHRCSELAQMVTEMHEHLFENLKDDEGPEETD